MDLEVDEAAPAAAAAERRREVLEGLKEVQEFVDRLEHLQTHEPPGVPPDLWQWQPGLTRVAAKWRFDDCPPDLFEWLCYGLIAARHDVFGRGRMLSGRVQDGIDFYAWERGPGGGMIACEAKHRSTRLTGSEITEAVERFLDRAPARWVRRFILMTSGDLAKRADGAKQACTENLRQHGIELEIWSREELWQEIARTPAVAAVLVQEPDRFDRLCGGYYTHLSRAKLALAEAERMADVESAAPGPFPTPQQPQFRKTDRDAVWTNGVVTLSAYLPRPTQSGTLAIRFNTPEHTGVTMTLTHEQILEVLWPCHNTGHLWTHRRFTQTAPSGNTIYLPNAALHTDQETLAAFTEAVDAVIPAYVDALRNLEESWEAQGMRFLYGGGGGPEVVLCSLPWWLWRDIMAFTHAHDFEAGRKKWFMFDAGTTLLRPHHKHETLDFDAGYHAILRVRGGELSGGDSAPAEVMLDLVWSADTYDGRPFSRRGIWSAGYAADWVMTQLIPEVRRRHRRKPPRRPLLDRLIARLIARLEDVDDDGDSPFLDHRRDATVGLVEHPDDRELRRAVDRMQVQAHALGHPEPFLIKPSDYAALLDQFAVTVARARRPHLHYAAGKLGLSGEAAEDCMRFSRELIDRSRGWGDRRVTGTELDLTLRALGSVLADTRPALSDDGRHQLAAALRPLAGPLDEGLLVRRHLPPVE